MSSVKLYVYDLSKGLAMTLSPMFLGRQIEGVWHTAIVVYGNEYFFGGAGIQYCVPGTTPLKQPKQIFDLGHTEVPKEVLKELLNDMNQDRFNGRQYNLFQHNCNNFSNELAQFLTGREIPEYITNLPAEILSTPFGVQLEQIISGMQEQLVEAPLYHHDSSFGLGSSPVDQSPLLPGPIRFSELPPDFPAPAPQSAATAPENIELQWLENGSPENVEARLIALFQSTCTDSSGGTGGILSTPRVAGLFMATFERLIDANGDRLDRLSELAGRVACNAAGSMVSSGGVPPERLAGCARTLLATGGRPGLPEAGGALALNLMLLEPGNEAIAFDLGCLISDRLQALAASGAATTIQLTLARALFVASRYCDQLVQLAAVLGLSLDNLACLCPHVARLQESISQVQQSMMQ